MSHRKIHADDFERIMARLVRFVPEDYEYRHTSFTTQEWGGSERSGKGPFQYKIEVGFWDRGVHQAHGEPVWVDITLALPQFPVSAMTEWLATHKVHIGVDPSIARLLAINLEPPAARTRAVNGELVAFPSISTLERQQGRGSGARLVRDDRPPR